jgi:hypothetical protein
MRSGDWNKISCNNNGMIWHLRPNMDRITRESAIGMALVIYIQN